MWASKEWLENLKVGDKVIVCTRWGKAVKTVTAINKATIKIGNDLYNKSNGDLRGRDRWSVNYITEPTDEVIAELKADAKLENARQKLRDSLQKINKFDLSIEQIEKISTLATEIFNIVKDEEES